MTARTGERGTRPEVDPGRMKWVEQIPAEEWQIFERVIEAARAAGIRFALGGAFAVATYTGRWRNTKDLDFYILPEQREAMIEVVTRAGLHDLFDELPYVRTWIYRATTDGTIVDVIWAMANQRTDVDEIWLTHGPEVVIRGQRLAVVPPEEMLWAKLYILQRERCDWGDALNILYGTRGKLDWERLVARVDEDMCLLAGLLSLFAWLAPGRARGVPTWVWERLQVAPPPDGGVEVHEQRVNLLDTRPWFGPDRGQEQT